MLTPAQQAAYDELCRLLPAPGSHRSRLPGGRPLPPRPREEDPHAETRAELRAALRRKGLRLQGKQVVAL